MPDNAAVSEYGSELALLWCVLLNVAVFGAAYRFAIRRMTQDRGQALLDAVLLDYAVQYAAIALPGTAGILRASFISAVAILISILLWAAGSNPRTLELAPPPRSQRIVRAAAIFAIAYLVAFAWTQRWLPVMSNDALTYHFPAAVQWLQTGRLGLFQAWFFNTANTFSPLAGSTFIAWLLTFFGNDVLARFVEMPGLLFVGIGAYQLCRQMRLEPITAALIAMAAILSRPLFFQSIMGKDDLFVTAFFICALLAMAPARSAESLAPLRLGIAIGLLMATKYTALLSAPILLIAIDGPIRSRWKWKQWGTAIGIAILFSGPWYVRNIWLTGNPIFPASLPIAGKNIFHGLFTSAPSENLRSIADVWNVITGGAYGLPLALLAILACAWLAAWVFRARDLASDPMVRACLTGPIIGLILFVGQSPFAEVRFILPVFILLFVSLALAIESVPCRPDIKNIAAFFVLAIAIWTEFVPGLRGLALNFLFTGAIATTAGTLLCIACDLQPGLGWKLLTTAGVLFLGIIYVYWKGYLIAYQALRFEPDGGWSQKYPAETSLWKFVDQNIPSDATLAYSNAYLIYPLQGFSLHRHLVYAPTRPGIHSQADLPWLGDRIPGEQLVSASSAVTIADSQRAVWLINLQNCAAQYIYIAKQVSRVAPPEADFAAHDPKHFMKLIENEAGVIYRIN